MREEDKRQFTRYSKESLCDVIVDSEIYKGKVVNYSDGVGVLMRNVPELVKGTLADIRILDCEIEFGAEVVWREEVGYHLKVGFKRLDNLKGNLKHYRLVDILLGLSKSRKTGILEIITGSTVKKIFIENGLKIFAVSTNTNDRLGEYLLTQGKITLEEYTQASYLVEKKGRRLGQILIDLGYLKSSDLAPSVQHQLEEIIMGLFNIDEGKFEFKEGPLSSDEPIKLNISSANIIYNGIKRINSFPMVDKMCPPLETVFNLSKDPISLFQSLTLDYADKKILANVNGIHTLKNILSLSHNSNFETLKAVIALLTIGLITIKGENDEPNKLPLEVIFGKPVEAPAEKVVEEKNQDDATHVETGTTEMTVEHTNIVENKRNIEETLKDEEPSVSKPHETPVEEIAEGNDGEEAPVDTGFDKLTVEYTSIVENQENLKEASKDEEPSISIPHETPVEEIAEENDDEEAVVDTGFDKSTVEYTNIVENQENLKEISKDEEPSISIPHEEPVEELAEDIHEKTALLDAETAEDSVDYTNCVKSNSEITELTNEQGAVTEVYDEVPVESTNDDIDTEQPAAYNVRYVEETSGLPEPAAMHTDMANAPGEEDYLTLNDMTSDNITSEVTLDDLQPTTDNADATESTQSKKKWVISVCIIIIIIGALVPLVYNNVKTPLSSPAATAVNNNESLSSMPDKEMKKASIEISKDTTSFPSFHEDAINKLLNQ